jgi:hypothetical protein
MRYFLNVKTITNFYWDQSNNRKRWRDLFFFFKFFIRIISFLGISFRLEKNYQTFGRKLFLYINGSKGIIYRYVCNLNLLYLP